MTEQWKDIKNYEELYQISNMGQIKSFHHKWRKYSSKILNPSLKNGYPFICLSKNNKKGRYYIHRLVLETFHRPWRYPPVLCGIEHGRAKLTNKDIRRIRQIYATGKSTQVQLSKQFNITHYTISDIVNRRTWKHI